MQVKNHILQGDDGPMPFFASPNHGGKIDPRYIIIHYTAGLTADGATATFLDPAGKTSAHLVIDRDGAIVQMVPFNQRAWHAGVSRWHGIEGLNGHSIGIELVNAGRLTRAPGRWLTWTGRVVNDADVVEAVHQHEHMLAGWHMFSEVQILAAVDACQAIANAYPDILDIIGHDDIAPGRKSDPGPAFPMASFRARALGRADSKKPLLYRTTTRLNLRAGPGPILILFWMRRCCRAACSMSGHARQAGARWRCWGSTAGRPPPAGFMATISPCSHEVRVIACPAADRRRASWRPDFVV